MFHARLVQYTLGTGQRLIAERLTKELDKESRSLMGFRGNVYFFDDSSGEYRVVNYWDTKQDAEAAHKVISPKLEEVLQKYTSEKPTYRFFEIFDVIDDGDIIASHTITK
ncbi:hypothetical protein RGU12_10980 [Fredinandcohnia sp. QZ13]|uniref:hypothetical protein n=1 Tax=Fredinandcohnia sp. QZ13 TaxID=3073144 RepID=UPI002852F767|nr:hypothetical protein [Fredinandcohnia sp. QZ13]MDR4888072.1 hypothetical protein [Fredinandcohnia sp. QZ13]